MQFQLYYAPFGHRVVLFKEVKVNGAGVYVVAKFEWYWMGVGRGRGGSQNISFVNINH